MLDELKVADNALEVQVGFIAELRARVSELEAERDALRDAATQALSLLENIVTCKWAKTPAGDALRTALAPATAKGDEG